jgi:hypothetical protein
VRATGGLRAIPADPGFASWVGRSAYGVCDPSDSRFPPSYNFSAVEHTSRARQLHRADPFPFMSESVVINTDGEGGYFLLISESTPAPHRVI